MNPTNRVNNINIKLIVIIGILLATSFFVYGYSQPPAGGRKALLADYVKDVDGYSIASAIALTDGHEKMLQLDDYLFANFTDGDNAVNLYIGYYDTASKAGAAHSPLICYPSQGWNVDTDPIRATLSAGPHTIHYQEIVTSNGIERDLVLYWYQAGLFTTTQNYRNKISMAYNKLVHHNEQHGFVRVSVPFTEGQSRAIARKTATDFIKAFYPRFVSYILA
jgi:EpsI family protein